MNRFFKSMFQAPLDNEDFGLGYVSLGYVSGKSNIVFLYVYCPEIVLSS